MGSTMAERIGAVADWLEIVDKRLARGCSARDMPREWQLVEMRRWERMNAVGAPASLAYAEGPSR